MINEEVSFIQKIEHIGRVENACRDAEIRNCLSYLKRKFLLAF